MIDPLLSLTPVLAAGVLGLVRFVGCDRLLGLVDIHPVAPPMVTYSVDPNNPPVERNDYDGFAGMVFQPAVDMNLVALGRWKSSGNSQEHKVKVVDDTGADVAGAAALIELSSGAESTFVFTDLTSPVKLTGGGMYFLVSAEVSGGDVFLDYGLTVMPTSDFQVPAAVYFDPGMGTYVQKGGMDNCYGPVNAKLSKS